MLLALAVLMLPVAQRLKIPYTVLLALVGFVLGGAGVLFSDASMTGVGGELLLFLKNFHINSEAVMFVFLPALVFESSLSINVYRLLDDLIPILALAILGLLISTFVVGLTLVKFTTADLLVCLLLGAIVSATDPVAVVALFKELQAPKRLAILVEGESLFNDATAIVMFTILSGMILQTSETSLFGGVISFIKVFFGGALVGYVMAWLLCAMFNHIRKVKVVKITLTICLAYLAFIVAEHIFHVSGVMASVTAGLVMGSLGQSVVSPTTWETMHETWDHIGFWANSFIFMLVGIAVPEILLDMDAEEFGAMFILIGAAFFARGLVIYAVLPAFTFGKVMAKVSAAYKAVMFWGGLRGAVSLALALAVMENPAFDGQTRHFVGIMVTGMVLFTLFVNAPTIGTVIRFFGLNKLSPADQAIRQRAMEVSLHDISDQLEKTAKELEVDASLADDVISQYRDRAEEVKAAKEGIVKISEEDWSRIGLTVLVSQEREGYLRLFEEGYVNSKIARLLLSQIEDLLDGIRNGGTAGYIHAYNRCLGFNWYFRLGTKLLSWTGYGGMLSQLLGDRYEMLISQKRVLGIVETKGIQGISNLFGDKLGEELSHVMKRRFRTLEKSVALFKLQYPEYAVELEKRYLSQVALRLEDHEFQEMLESYVISREVYNDLEKELDASARKMERRPKLDLGLDPEKLLSKVPFFAKLPPESIKQMVALLRPRLALPGEKVVEKGETGDAMYFISSGCMEVELEPEPILLGTNDFFGEIALLKEMPRVADVVAHGFCDLLVLEARDFQAFLKDYPDLKQTIEATAQERLHEDGMD